MTLGGVTATGVTIPAPQGTITILNDDAPPTVTAIPAASTICSGGSVGLTASGASLYSWSPATGLSGTTGTVVTANPTTTTTYTVTGTTATGCQNTAQVTITVNPLPTLFNVTGGGGFCSGGTGVVVGLSGSQSGVNYQLKLSGANQGSPVVGTGAAISFGNQISAGTYSVVATDTTTACVATMSGSVTATVNPLPTVFNVTEAGIIAQVVWVWQWA